MVSVAFAMTQGDPKAAMAALRALAQTFDLSEAFDVIAQAAEAKAAADQQGVA